jgi:hypothetical protein
MSKRVLTLSQAKDYRPWLTQITAHLQAKGLGGYLNSKIERPEEPQDKEPPHVFKARKLKFSIRQEQTLGIIKTYVHPSVLTFVETATTPKEAIEALSKQFQPAGSARFLTAISRLFTLRKQPDQSIATYFAEINELITTAFPDITEDIPATANEGQKAIARTALQNLFNKWILAVTLNGLTSDYDTVKAIIQDWSDVNIERARSRIREHELEIKAATGQASDQLLYVHAPNA